MLPDIEFINGDGFEGYIYNDDTDEGIAYAEFLVNDTMYTVQMGKTTTDKVPVILQLTDEDLTTFDAFVKSIKLKEAE